MAYNHAAFLMTSHDSGCYKQVNRMRRTTCAMQKWCHIKCYNSPYSVILLSTGRLCILVMPIAENAKHDR